MGLSPFKTRWQLLLEKAGLEERDTFGTRYTVYGQKIEPQIRDYINETMPFAEQFEPNRVIDGDTRYHSDGFNGKCVLEIKSTSHIYETVDEYKIYLVQLLFGMQKNKVENGKLAVYERPDDFDIEFDATRLQVFDITAGQYKNLTAEINAEIERFRRDLARLKENPLLSEADFQPNELVSLSNKVIVLENRMAEFKALEKQYKDMKQSLFEAMQKHDVKSWEMPNGTKITRVDGVAASEKTVTVFDVDTFKAENTELYEKYQKTVIEKKAGRAGYVRISNKE